MVNVLNYFAQPIDSANKDNVANFGGTVNITGTIQSSVIAHTQLVTVTQAEINAGKITIPLITGKKIKPAFIAMLVNGNFATGTAIVLQDSNGTPVVVMTYAVAALTDGAYLLPNSANVTIGAGYMADLTISKSLNITKTGSDFTGGTSVTLMITYQYV